MALAKHLDDVPEESKLGVLVTAMNAILDKRDVHTRADLLNAVFECLKNGHDDFVESRRRMILFKGEIT
jgi:hypothetical protein